MRDRGACQRTGRAQSRCERNQLQPDVCEETDEFRSCAGNPEHVADGLGDWLYRTWSDRNGTETRTVSKHLGSTGQLLTGVRAPSKRGHCSVGIRWPSEGRSSDLTKSAVETAVDRHGRSRGDAHGRDRRSGQRDRGTRCLRRGLRRWRGYLTRRPNRSLGEKSPVEAPTTIRAVATRHRLNATDGLPQSTRCRTVISPNAIELATAGNDTEHEGGLDRFEAGATEETEDNSQAETGGEPRCHDRVSDRDPSLPGAGLDDDRGPEAEAEAADYRVAGVSKVGRVLETTGDAR